MNTLTALSAAIALLIACYCKPAPNDHAWPQSVKSRAELFSTGMFAAEWTEITHEGMQLAFAIEVWPTDGESYIDVYGYVYSRSFEEWRQFFAVKLRGAGHAVLRYDEAAGAISVLGAANNHLNGVPLFTFDLDAVYDDHAYVH